MAKVSAAACRGVYVVTHQIFLALLQMSGDTYNWPYLNREEYYYLPCFQIFRPSNIPAQSMLQDNTLSLSLFQIAGLFIPGASVVAKPVSKVRR